MPDPVNRLPQEREEHRGTLPDASEPALEGRCSRCQAGTKYHYPKLDVDEVLFCGACALAVRGADQAEKPLYARTKIHPAERVVALVAERFQHRHGRAPSRKALDAYRAQMFAWDPKLGDLSVMADWLATYKRQHPVAWAMRATGSGRTDDLAGLHAVAKDLGRTLTREELEKS